MMAVTVTAAASPAKRLRVMRKPLILAAVAGLHVLVLISVAHQVPESTPILQPRTLYASVISEPAPQPSAAPQPAPVVAPPPTPVAIVQPAPRPRPLNKPHVAQHSITPPPQPAVSVPQPASAPAAAVAVAAAPVAAPAAAPQPKTITHGVEYLHAPVPEYPDSAREDGNEGTVVLRVLVDESGKPARVDVVRSSGFGSLDDAGRAAAQGALFKPYREDGHAVSVYVIVPLKFQLDS